MIALPTLRINFLGTLGKSFAAVEAVFRRADVDDSFSRRAVAVSGAELFVVRSVNFVFFFARSSLDDGVGDDEEEDAEVVVVVDGVNVDSVDPPISSDLWRLSAPPFTVILVSPYRAGSKLPT
jgi:hypothetical protein